MHYMALACDYDSTLASNGQVDDATLAALERVKAAGRRLILVTGRQLPDLQRVFPDLGGFDRVVVENGAVLFNPSDKSTRRLAEPPPPIFADALREKGIEPLSVGEVIVATWQPNEIAVLETIRGLGLELQIIFNKGAVMVLPTGVNKSLGLSAALAELGLSPHNTVAVGDAENDHAFLALCGCRVAVANALPMICEAADLVTAGARGQGVIELIDRLIADDLSEVDRNAAMRGVVLGETPAGDPIWLPRRDELLLLAGTSGSGKSTLTAGLLERLVEQSYQFCVIDPEGDYEAMAGAIVVGDSTQPPTPAKVLELLEPPHQSVIVNLLGVKLEDRPAFLGELLPGLLALRKRAARPHWLFVDEAHHMLSGERSAGREIELPSAGLFLITVHPDKLAPAALAAINTVVVVGKAVQETLSGFASIAGWPAAQPDQNLEQGEAFIQARNAAAYSGRLRIMPPRGERQRHVRKYAEGKLGTDKSFYFRGADRRLNLRAHNLEIFMQMADGVDNDTWLYHLRNGDYSRWFREAIKDDALAESAARIEADLHLDSAASRSQIRAAIQERYTASP